MCAHMQHNERMTNAPSIGKVLADFGRGMTEDDVARILRDTLSTLPDPAATTLPAHQRDLLVSMSGLSEKDQATLIADLADPASQGRVHRENAVAAVTEMLASSLGYAEVAELLGVNASTVTRAATAGRLYAVIVDGQRRFPSWQFLDGKQLPGFAEIAGAIPDGLSPNTVAAVMTTPDEWLNDTSPVQWLASGGRPDRVVSLLEGLERW